MRAYERFLQYTAFNTASREDAGTTPSTPGQHDLAAFLAQELRGLGLADVRADEHAYVFGRLPASPGCEHVTPIGLIAHIDTVPIPEGGVVKPQLIRNYDGGEVPLGDSGLLLSPASFPHLAKLKGEDLIVTDGTTILGADDKAGVAEIMTALERLVCEKRPHGTVCVCFPPDEEIGHGAALLDPERFGAAYAYTLDGSDIDEIESENFNAASVRVTFRGREVHPGSAKDIMINAASLAAQFVAMLPPDEVPEHTEGYQGFYHLTSIEGDTGSASLSLIIRDHSREKFLARKQTVTDICARLRQRFGEGTVELSMRDQYHNMAEVLADRPEVLDEARAAIRSVGCEPVSRPVRGGTDGAQLSFRGLPCPNLGTGGFAFHGPYEHVSVQRMDRMVDIVLALIGRLAEKEAP